MSQSMHELEPSELALVRPFFPEGTPGHAFVAALLEGSHLGRAFVDAPESPSTALVALACGFLYVAGRTGGADAHKALRSLILDVLTPLEEYAVVFPTSDAWQETLGAIFADALELHHGGRDEYTFDRDRFTAAGPWQEAAPEGFEVCAYDRTLAEGQGFPEFWGSVERFLERGIGFAVIKDGEVVSRCHSVMVGAGEAEISIETAEAYRRQGLGTLAVRAFIDHCLAVGLCPAWSNWTCNTPSRSMAERLGFVHRGTTPASIVRVR